MSRTATSRAMSNLERQLNTLFNPFIGWNGRTEDLGFSGYGPAIDILEDGEAFYIYADVPGFTAESLQIKFENRTLTLTGERKLEEGNGVRYHRNESFTGRFQRSFSLPHDVDAEKIEAEVKNGVLTITLPKQELSKPRQISVKVS